MREVPPSEYGKVGQTVSTERPLRKFVYLKRRERWIYLGVNFLPLQPLPLAFGVHLPRMFE